MQVKLSKDLPFIIQTSLNTYEKYSEDPNSEHFLIKFQYGTKIEVDQQEKIGILKPQIYEIVAHVSVESDLEEDLLLIHESLLQKHGSLFNQLNDLDDSETIEVINFEMKPLMPSVLTNIDIKVKTKEQIVYKEEIKKYLNSDVLYYEGFWMDSFYISNCQPVSSGFYVPGKTNVTFITLDDKTNDQPKEEPEAKEIVFENKFIPILLRSNENDYISKNVVFVSWRILIQLKMHSGSNVLLQSNNMKYPCQIQALNDLDDCQYVFLSPLLYHNISANENLFVSILPYDQKYEKLKEVKIYRLGQIEYYQVKEELEETKLKLEDFYTFLNKKFQQSLFRASLQNKEASIENIVWKGKIFPVTVNLYEFITGTETRHFKLYTFYYQVSSFSDDSVEMGLLTEETKIEISPETRASTLPPFHQEIRKEINYQKIFEDFWRELKSLQFKHLLIRYLKDDGPIIGEILNQFSNHYGIHYIEVDCGGKKGMENIWKAMQQAEYINPCIIHFNYLHSLKISTQTNEQQQQNETNQKLQSVEEMEFEISFKNSLQKLKKKNALFWIIGTFEQEEEEGSKFPSWLSLCQVFKQELKLSVSNEQKMKCFQQLMEKSDFLIAYDTIEYDRLPFCKLQHFSLHLQRSLYQQHKRLIRSNAGLKVKISSNEVIQILNQYLKQSQKSKFQIQSIPNTKWSDIGGLELAKKEIKDTIQLPLQYPELFQQMKARTGILFYGPPGCGKTLLAKCIANELQCTFFSIKGPELMHSYVGETERTIRQIFHQAKRCKKAVLFFDELDSIGVKRESNDVMSRIVSQLISELDQLSESSNFVFVIGATNRPDLLDDALLRPGRLDRLVYLSTSQTKEEHLQILEASCRKYELDDDVHLTDWAERIPLGRWTGADFKAFCSNAYKAAILEKIELLEEILKGVSLFFQSRNKKGKGKQRKHFVLEQPEKYIKKEVFDKIFPLEISIQLYLNEICPDPKAWQSVKVSEKHFQQSFTSHQPSVSETELKKYAQIQSQFQKQRQQ